MYFFILREPPEYVNLIYVDTILTANLINVNNKQRFFSIKYNRLNCCTTKSNLINYYLRHAYAQCE